MVVDRRSAHDLKPLSSRVVGQHVPRRGTAHFFVEQFDAHIDTFRHGEIKAELASVYLVAISRSAAIVEEFSRRKIVFLVVAERGRRTGRLDRCIGASRARDTGKGKCARRERGEHLARTRKREGRLFEDVFVRLFSCPIRTDARD